MTEPLATIRTQDDLIEALRTVKAMRGLSNEFCDERGGITKGHTDKALGPTRAKSLSPMLLDLFMTMFAVKLIMVPDLEAEVEMREKWEGRDTSNVRVQHRVSRVLLERAKPHVLSAIGRAGGLKTSSQPSAKLRNRKAGKSRMRKLSKKERTALARMANAIRWSKRRTFPVNKPCSADGPAGDGAVS